ncbi:MAG: hypothetical protein Q4D07_06290 [Selenomonadaceae bacterium]|nr:hypothetical protein [Selenomonadaceae bacterium]
MRIKEKKEIIEFVDQLGEIISTGPNDAAVLSMAAETAEAIGKLCKKAGKEKQALYSEVFDGIQNALNVGAEETNPDERQQIITLVLDLIQSVKTELEKEPAKKEIVFLPYKASMWDSLESVWRAAYEDRENCNTYVIPIPYADRNPDGSAKEWHCEINEFPKDVPVIDYRVVDLKELNPDEIYIHNPYDGYNFITSVDSRYYSSELVKYTDKLIYIPYFVLDDINSAPETVEHFADVPAVHNAHIVILQSEKMRERYVKALVGIYGEQTRSVWEEKIKGWGSPKLDKVKNTKREDIEIPEAWERIIKKPDGSCKKVILYNTGLSTLLKEGEKLLRKIESTFRIFYEHRGEVALWWRPHPLIPATLDSMRPELKQQYSDIVAKFKNDGWGIYDDTADLNRAIAASDAYYGDASSLTKLFQEAGKPAMIENVGILSS